MAVVNIYEAKSQLSELIRRVLAGEEVVIARRNAPMVRLVPVAGARPERRLGTARGEVTMADDFDAPLEDFEEYRR